MFGRTSRNYQEEGNVMNFSLLQEDSLTYTPQPKAVMQGTLRSVACIDA